MRGDGDVVRDRDGRDERCDVLRTSAVQYVHFIQSEHRAVGKYFGVNIVGERIFGKNILIAVATPCRTRYILIRTFSAEIVLTASEVFCHLAVIFSV